MHTDRYLHFQSHYTINVKWGVVRYLHDRARWIINTERSLKTEVKHLSRVILPSGYPANFIHNSSVPTARKDDWAHNKKDEKKEDQKLVVIPYIPGLSEGIRCVCKEYNIRVAFKSEWTLQSMLSRVNDTLPAEKQSNVVCELLCSCGEIYIGKTKWRLDIRLKEHQIVCRRGMTGISEHGTTFTALTGRKQHCWQFYECVRVLWQVVLGKCWVHPFA